MPAPHLDPVTAALAEVHERARTVTAGAVADYIPELAHADPDAWGLSVVSVRGHVYDLGDAGTPFTVQSVSKPFVFALALQDLGLDGVLRHVGCEPSGEPFNAISLDPAGRPENPMINAGAIVTTALVAGRDAEERFERIRACLSAFAGRELELDAAVHASEAATGDRNRALGYLTRATGALPGGDGAVLDATDVYFRQCALLVTARDLAVMGATLAAGGRNPLTGVRVVEAAVARHTLSLMASCGMYDRSGEWQLRVGFPAKSGVGGGIVAVKPGQLGVGTFGPRLDEAGNSTRGVAALTVLSGEYDLHLLAQPDQPASPVLRSDLVDGRLTLVLRGELGFLDAEVVAHEVLTALDDPEPGAALTEVHLDLSRVGGARPVAARLLRAVGDLLRSEGRSVTLTDPDHLVPEPERAP